MTTLNVISTPSFGRGAILVLTAALLGACGGDHNLGGEPTGGAGTSGAAGTTGSAGAYFGSAGNGFGGPIPSGAAGTSAPVIGPLGPTESWTGYIENQTFASGSDKIKVSFATDSAGHAVGTVVFGQGTPPPPATDPNVGYPPSLHSTGLGTLIPWHIVEGYSYSFSGTLESNRLRFQAQFAELWKDWCALQTSYAPGATCLPESTMSKTDPMGMHCEYLPVKTNKWTPVNCDKLALCIYDPPCDCDATSCRYSPLRAGTAKIDLQISGNMAAGSIAGNPPVSGYVRFTKDPQ